MNQQRTTTGGSETTDVAQREGQRVKGTAKDAASNVGDAAAQRGQQVKAEAKRHASNLFDEARSKLRGHADEETQRAGSALSTAGDQLQALADGRVDEAGVLGDYVEQLAGYVNRWADTVEQRGLDGLLEDARNFGRRRPGMFLLSALVAGVAVGRFGRNVAPEVSDDSDAGSQRALPSSSSDDDEQSSTMTGAGVREESDTDQWRTDAGGSREPRVVDATRSPEGAETEDTALTATDHADDPTTRRARPDDDDVIVGYATDDSGVVNSGDDVEYRSIDVDQERAR